MERAAPDVDDRDFSRRWHAYCGASIDGALGTRRDRLREARVRWTLWDSAGAAREGEEGDEYASCGTTHEWTVQECASGNKSEDSRWGRGLPSSSRRKSLDTPRHPLPRVTHPGLI